LKAPSFAYAKSQSREEVFDLLDRHGDGARILAGGQSLLATLNLRLSAPELLIDITGLPGLAGIKVPMAAEMPDIVCAHVETPTRQSQLGAKGAGEAGTAGAPGAVMNAINDALAPFNVRVTSQPLTPDKILRALGKG